MGELVGFNHATEDRHIGCGGKIESRPIGHSGQQSIPNGQTVEKNVGGCHKLHDPKGICCRSGHNRRPLGGIAGSWRVGKGLISSNDSEIVSRKPQRVRYREDLSSQAEGIARQKVGPCRLNRGERRGPVRAVCVVAVEADIPRALSMNRKCQTDRDQERHYPHTSDHFQSSLYYYCYIQTIVFFVNT